MEKQVSMALRLPVSVRMIVRWDEEEQLVTEILSAEIDLAVGMGEILTECMTDDERMELDRLALEAR